MIILGIDPGSRKAGFGLIELKGRKINYLESGVMKYDCKKDFMDRLGNIHDSCSELVKIFSPDHIAIESLIYVKSVTSLAKLAQARGAMIASFMKTHKEKVFEYSPNAVKSTVTGHGHADKESINKTLKMMFKNQIKTDFSSDDESDAVAIAVCHAILKNQPIKKSEKIFTGGRSLKEAFK